MSEVFTSRQGDSPLLLSFPHDGTAFPEALEARLTDAGRRNVDCDWYVSRLYPFVEQLDASVIRAHYSRYVVDLNRPTDGEALYPGKMETGICPLRTFAGDAIYRQGEEPGDGEIQLRIARYWQPYHDHIEKELERIRARHGHAILWDAHTIRGEVPSLFEGRLPDLNFGTNDGHSCNREVVEQLLSACGDHSAYSVVLNGRFRGGYITRHYGDPANGIHAMQLEINQDTYMEAGDEPVFDKQKSEQLIDLLESLVEIAIAGPG